MMEKASNKQWAEEHDQIARNIRRLRVSKDMEQEEMAVPLGFHPRTVSTWEAPSDRYWAATPKARNRKKICAFFGVGPEELRK